MNINIRIFLQQFVTMQLRSELLSIKLPDETGKIVPYYTYDGYLEENDRHRIRRERRSNEKLAVTAYAIFGLAGFAATRRLSLPVFSFRGYSIPVAGLFSGFVSAELGYGLFNLIGSTRNASTEREALLAAKHLPLWSNLRNAVNPDRAFFELADERNNEPLIFHSGLTPEAAARLIPDKIIGTVPHKPHAPSASHDAHHH